MINLKELKALMREHHFWPKKRLGQNFLTDANIGRKIIESCGLSKRDLVVEIGPGLGELTEDLARRARRVLAVEVDKRLCEILTERLKYSRNVEVINTDFLKLDLARFLKRKKAKVIGNLPYYVTTPIIARLIENRNYIEAVYVTVQREVADRLLAAPGSKDYGAISCFVQYYTDVRKLLKIPRSCFYPRPDVDSSFLLMRILKKPKVKVGDETLFFKIIRASFGQRRKTLVNALTSKSEFRLTKEKLHSVLSRLSLDTNIRGESLSLQDFAKISDLIGRR